MGVLDYGVSVPCSAQNVFATEEIPGLLVARAFLSSEMGVTSIASVLLVTGGRPKWYLLACPQEDDRMLKISPCPVEIIPSVNKVC